MVDTHKEEIEIMGLYYKHGQSARISAFLHFTVNKNHPAEICHKYVFTLLHKFMISGNVNNGQHDS